MASSMTQVSSDQVDLDPASYQDWMGNLPEKLHDLPLNHLAIPGSHDSTTFYLDKHAPLHPNVKLSSAIKWAYKWCGRIPKDIVSDWARTQDLDYSAQLNAGVRYFDLRISTKPDTPNFYLVHSMFSHTLRDFLGAINTFCDNHSKEVVLLDMNHFYGFGRGNAHHERCIELIQEVLQGKLWDYHEHPDMTSMTLANLWQNGKQVIVFYHHPKDKLKDNLETNSDNTPTFWPGSKMVSPFPEKADTDKLMRVLEANYTKGRSNSANNTFYVTQGVLTPTTCTIIWNLRGTLKKCCSEKMAPVFTKWLSGKRAGATGINVCIMDCVHLNNYIPTVIALNSTLAEELMRI